MSKDSGVCDFEGCNLIAWAPCGALSFCSGHHPNRTPAPRICIPENVGKTLVHVQDGDRVRLAALGATVRLHFEGGYYEYNREVVERDYRLADEPGPVAKVGGARWTSVAFDECADEPAPGGELRLGGPKDHEFATTGTTTVAFPPKRDDFLFRYMPLACAPPSKFIGIRDVGDPPVPPPKAHDFSDPYCRGCSGLLCLDCGTSEFTIGRACKPESGWREARERQVADIMRARDVALCDPDATTRPEPHSPSISGLGAIGCRLTGRRR